MSFRWFLLAFVVLAALLYYGFMHAQATPALGPASNGPSPRETEALKAGPTKGGPAFKPARGMPVVPPGYRPPEASGVQVKRLVDRRLSLQDRVPLDIIIKLPVVIEAFDIAAVTSVLKDSQDDDTVRNEAANLLRRSKYRQLPGILMEVLGQPAEKERFRTFALQHLAALLEEKEAYDTEAIAKRIEEALADRHSGVRREALLALVRVRHPKGAPTALAWLQATGPEAQAYRDVAIRCICDLDLKDQIPAIRKFARDEDPVTDRNLLFSPEP